MHSEYDAVVYDLDGTLVDLVVDWDAVAGDVTAALEARGVDATGHSLWEMLELGDETGHRETVEAAIAEHERAGARDSVRLPLADELPLEVPVGLCSLNCEAACRIALDRHDIAGHVDAVVGRDSVPTHKPDPGPLLAVAEDLGVDPSAMLFVGDSERDGVAADRASMAFQWASDRQSR